MLPRTRSVASTSGESLNQLTAVQILQRVYKYGGQPFVRDYLADNHGAQFDKWFGKGTGKAMLSAFSGRCATKHAEIDNTS